jgi:hypothetical protein
LTLQPRPARRRDVWIIRRRSALIAGLVSLALTLIITFVLFFGRDLLYHFARPLLVWRIASDWCEYNIHPDGSSCSTWARHFMDDHPTFTQECGETVVDYMAFEGCIDRFIERNP